MEFDLNRFDFDSYTDLIKKKKNDPDRFKACYEMSRIARLGSEYISAYKGLIKDGKTKCRLNAEHIDEFAARCDLIATAGALYGDKFKNLLSAEKMIEKTGLSFDDILHTPEEEFKKMIKDAKNDADYANFWNDVSAVVKALSGFDVKISLSSRGEYFRIKRGLLGVSRADEMINILSRQSNVLKDADTGALSVKFKSEEDFASQFESTFEEKSLSVSERQGKLFNKKSRLYKKRITSDLAKEKSRMMRDEVFECRKNIPH